MRQNYEIGNVRDNGIPLTEVKRGFAFLDLIVLKYAKETQSMDTETVQWKNVVLCIKLRNVGFHKQQEQHESIYVLWAKEVQCHCQDGPYWNKQLVYNLPHSLAFFFMSYVSQQHN